MAVSTEAVETLCWRKTKDFVEWLDAKLCSANSIIFLSFASRLFFSCPNEFLKPMTRKKKEQWEGRRSRAKSASEAKIEQSMALDEVERGTKLKTSSENFSHRRRKRKNLPFSVADA